MKRGYFFMERKTVLELSEEFGVNKMKVYRFFQKANIKHVTTHNGKYYYDDAAISIAREHFAVSCINENPLPNDTRCNESTLQLLREQLHDYKKQLEIKDNQLLQANGREIELQKLLDQQQQLHMQNQQQTQKLLEESQPKRKWWQFSRSKEA